MIYGLNTSFPLLLIISNELWLWCWITFNRTIRKNYRRHHCESKYCMHYFCKKSLHRTQKILFHSKYWKALHFFFFFFFVRFFIKDFFEELHEDHSRVEVEEDDQWKRHSLDDDPLHRPKKLDLQSVGFNLEKCVTSCTVIDYLLLRKFLADFYLGIMKVWGKGFTYLHSIWVKHTLTFD